MDKHRYIAELEKLLVFMTSADREETARLYAAAFDAAGEEGLDALLARLGSPTRAAIRLSRTYEPGHIEDEALQAVTYFIDDAIQFNAGRVRILHGTGTGALRQSIRDYLDSVPAVRRYADEDIRFGGAGITVVEF